MLMNYSCIYLHHLWGLIQHNKLDGTSLSEREHWPGSRNLKNAFITLVVGISALGLRFDSVNSA